MKISKIIIVLILFISSALIGWGSLKGLVAQPANPSTGWLTPTNAPPVITDVRLSPTYPTITDTLAVNYLYLDADGDPEMATEIRWYRNDLMQPQFYNQTSISSTEMRVGETWCVTVRAFDGEAYSLVTDPVCVVIRPKDNYVPEVYNAFITTVQTGSLQQSVFRNTPDRVAVKNTLVLNYDYIDIDNDDPQDVEIRWYRDGIFEPAFLNQQQVPTHAILAGEIWHATVRASDGRQYSLPAVTQEVMIFDPHQNTPPYIQDIKLNARQLATNAPLQLNYTYLDVDGDSETVSQIYWFKNGQTQPLHHNQTAISSTVTAVGDTWFALVAVADGYGSGPFHFSPVTTIVTQTGNLPPQLSKLQLSPAYPGPDDDLVIDYTYYDPEGDPEQPLEVAWILNSEVLTYLSDMVPLPGFVTSPGETWCIRLTPRDTFGAGQPLRSNCITIADTVTGSLRVPPQALNTHLESYPPLAGKPLKIRYDYHSPDNIDEQDTQIHWYTNGILTAFTQTIVAGEHIQVGDVWSVTLVVSDGELYGQPITLSAQVNTPPTYNTVKIIPETPRTDQSLYLFTDDYTDRDNDAPHNPQINWYRNQTLVYTNQNKLPYTDTHIGEHWFATVSPFDGYEYGQTLTTAEVIILSEFPINSQLYLPTILKNYAYQIACAFPYEDNDLLAQADRCPPLVPDEIYKAYADDQEDIYYFETTSATGLEVDVRDYEGDGQLLIYYGLLISDEWDCLEIARGISLKGRIKVPDYKYNYLGNLDNLPPGKYYLRVYTANGFDSTSPYRLDFTLKPPDLSVTPPPLHCQPE